MTDASAAPRPSWGRTLLKVAAWLGWAVAAVVAVRGGQVPPPPPIEGARPAVAEEAPGHATGWVHDADAIGANLDPDQTQHFDRTPAGRAAFGDAEAFLWQAVRKVGGRPAPWYPNVDQKAVGCCVGCGWKHAADVCQAAQIIGGRFAAFKPVSVEVIYAGSRVEVGGGRMSGDGSVGQWAAKWCSTYGVVAMDRYPAADLTSFDPLRARQWGARGMPPALEAAAKEHPVKDTALVKGWGDVQRAVLQGYPVAVCSDRGFATARDADGFAAPRGTWNHCMACIGVRGGPRPGGFILNSWGDAAHTGPAWPADMPAAGFWADAAVVDRMVRQGDSFALSGFTGFPAQPLNWLIRGPDAGERLALRR